jgi:hypothetical protein
MIFTNSELPQSLLNHAEKGAGYEGFGGLCPLSKHFALAVVGGGFGLRGCVSSLSGTGANISHDGPR